MLIGDSYITPKNGKYYKYSVRNIWMLLYHYNSKKESAFNENEAKFSFLDDKYSILGSLNDRLRIFGKFEFLLEYPSLNLQNHWAQSINPTITQESNEATCHAVDGYEPISVNMTSRCFGGLIRSINTKTFIDGTTYHIDWYYSIGTYWLYDEGNYPGPDEGKRVYESALWIRIDNSQNTCRRRCDRLNLMKGITIILILAS